MNTKNNRPVSVSQRQFFLEWLINPDDDTYNEWLMYRISGNFSPSVLRKAIEAHIKKHEAYSVCFNEEGTHYFLKNYLIDDFFFEHEFSDEDALFKYIQQKHRTSFDLCHQPLCQFYLLKVQKNSSTIFYFFIRSHHIGADGTFALHLIQETHQFYNAILDELPFDVEWHTGLLTQAVDLEHSIATPLYKKMPESFG